MEKTKEKIQEIRDNGVKKKHNKDEMIKKLEAEIAEIVKMYHQRTDALAYLKEID